MDKQTLKNHVSMKKGHPSCIGGEMFDILQGFLIYNVYGCTYILPYVLEY